MFLLLPCVFDEPNQEVSTAQIYPRSYVNDLTRLEKRNIEEVHALLKGGWHDT